MVLIPDKKCRHWVKKGRYYGVTMEILLLWLETGKIMVRNGVTIIDMEIGQMRIWIVIIKPIGIIVGPGDELLFIICVCCGD